MSDFARNKIGFALALLGTLFALKPYIDREDQLPPQLIFDYLGVHFSPLYAFGLAAALLSLSVYCYAMILVSERTSGWLGWVGNLAYAIAVMVLPLYGGFVVAHLLADYLKQPHLHWVAPTVAVLFGLLWLGLAWGVGERLTSKDRLTSITQLRDQELVYLQRAREMFDGKHYDLAVIEAWRALESRLQSILLARGIATGKRSPLQLIELAYRKGLINDQGMQMIQELRRQWNIAIGVVPLTREAAESALAAARNLLASIALEAVPPPGPVTTKRV
jgi:HEPN domain-containing protein